MPKKIIYMFILAFFTVSCGGSLDSVQRGLSGVKKLSTDEFLVKKKDPLILPPDYENLPIPDESAVANEDSSTFEKSLEVLFEDDSSTSSSVEDSILKKIQSR